MRVFDELGRSLGYEVEIGWLYDMTWYVEEERVMSDLPMILQHVPTAMNRDSQDTPEVRV
jgi:hypothetical protein